MYLQIELQFISFSGVRRSALTKRLEIQGKASILGLAGWVFGIFVET
jgi:hypothetical protein